MATRDGDKIGPRHAAIACVVSCLGLFVLLMRAVCSRDGSGPADLRVHRIRRIGHSMEPPNPTESSYAPTPPTRPPFMGFSLEYLLSTAAPT